MRPAPSLTSGTTVTVDSIPALLSTLKDDSIDVIIVKDGTYHVSPSNESAPDSLWIGEDFATEPGPCSFASRRVAASRSTAAGRQASAA